MAQGPKAPLIEYIKELAPKPPRAIPLSGELLAQLEGISPNILFHAQSGIWKKFRALGAAAAFFEAKLQFAEKSTAF
ncbi:MAG: hypothetical protein U9R52_03300, partial [Candidatus Omnitrophota bacterium]|nr:hypothetical protein [Candidatus Omnitrophota bacterium]